MAQVLTTDPAVFEFNRGGGATIQIQTGAADATVELGIRRSNATFTTTPAGALAGTPKLVTPVPAPTVDFREIGTVTAADAFNIRHDLPFNQIRVSGHGEGQRVTFTEGN